MRLSICLGIFLYVFISACSSPQKSFDKGDYEKAYKSALKNIKKGKKSRKDKVLLNKSFNELVKQKSNEAERYLRSNDLGDWEMAYLEYDDLLDLYYDGKVQLDNSHDARLAIIQREQDTLGVDIARNYYELGSMSMDGYYEEYNKAYAQDAFLYYEKTALYDADYPAIDSLREDAFDLAVVNVLVEVNAPFERIYEWEIDRRFSDIERESEGFYEISYERNLTNVDCTLEVDFSSIDSYASEDRSAQRFSEEIEDGYETRVDTSGNSTRVPLYRTVTGEVTTIREILTYRWRVAVSVFGSRDFCDFRNRNFETQEETFRERYEISGDRRAIPSGYESSRGDFDDEDDIVDEMIDDLYREISNYYF